MAEVATTAVGGMLADAVSEEQRTALGSLITQIINTVRTVIAYVMEMVRRFISWTGEHPLAATLAVANICIWVA